MTRNQIEFWNLSETRRANQARERETSRHNTASLAEQVRSNKENERERNRANLINEAHNRATLAESIRASQAKEQLESRKLAESERANRASERELSRSNLAKETETKRSNLAREIETVRSNVARETETNRANVAKETETNRANIARETETHRSNYMNEVINSERNDINREHFERMDTETNRANLARESLQQQSNEIAAANLELGYYGQDTSRRNVDIQSATNRYAADTNAAVGYANLAEQTRSHLVNELLQQQSLGIQQWTNEQRNERSKEQNITNQYNAQTGRLQYGLQQGKTAAEVENLQSQAQLNQAKLQTETTLLPIEQHLKQSQTKLNENRLNTETINAWSSLLGGVGRIIGGQTNGKKK